MRHSSLFMEGLAPVRCFATVSVLTVAEGAAFPTEHLMRARA